MIWIPYNTPSSKNSRVWTGRYFVVSALTTKWRKNTDKYWKEHKEEFLKQLQGKEKPYLIGLHFVRDSRRKFDFVNPVQSIQDEMKKQGWITDDNCGEILPYPLEIEGRYYSIDKSNPGVFIHVK